MPVQASELDTMLEHWIRATTAMPSRKDTKHFSQFVDWVHFYGLEMPANGEAVAAYLLELMSDGVSLSEVKLAAQSITDAYARRRCFLDILPIRAALAMCEAQLSPNRVLN